MADQMDQMEKTLLAVTCRKCLGRGRMPTDAGALVRCRWCSGARVNYTDQYHIAVYLRAHPWRDRLAEFHTHEDWRRRVVLVVPRAQARRYSERLLYRPSFAEWVRRVDPEYAEERRLHRLETLKQPHGPHYFTEAALTNTPTDPLARVMTQIAVDGRGTPPGPFMPEYQGVFPIAIDPNHPVGQITAVTSELPHRPVARVFNIGGVPPKPPEMALPPWESEEDDDP